MFFFFLFSFQLFFIMITKQIQTGKANSHTRYIYTTIKDHYYLTIFIVFVHIIIINISHHDDDVAIIIKCWQIVLHKKTIITNLNFLFLRFYDLCSTIIWWHLWIYIVWCNKNNKKKKFQWPNDACVFYFHLFLFWPIIGTQNFEIRGKNMFTCMW